MKRTIRNKSKKNRKHRHKKSCGCTKKQRKMMGGNINPASFQPFQQHQDQYHYDVNNYVNDPNDPSVTMSSRNFPDIVGGKKRRKTKCAKRCRKMRGGNVDFFLGNGSSNNALTSFGSIDGALMGKSIISGQQLTDGSVFNQPAYSTYNANSTPLA
jgi:hypothetical protein